MNEEYNRKESEKGFLFSNYICQNVKNYISYISYINTKDKFKVIKYFI